MWLFHSLWIVFLETSRRREVSRSTIQSEWKSHISINIIYYYYYYCNLPTLYFSHHSIMSPCLSSYRSLPPSSFILSYLPYLYTVLVISLSISPPLSISLASSLTHIYLSVPPLWPISISLCLLSNPYLSLCASSLTHIYLSVPPL